MDYCPLWFADPKNYEAGDEIFAMAETLLDLKEDVKLKARVNKEGAFLYILVKDSHPSVFPQLKASVIVFPTRWMVKYAFLAVPDVFS